MKFTVHRGHGPAANLRSRTRRPLTLAVAAGMAVRFSTFVKFAVGTTASLVGLMVAAPAVSSATPASMSVPCTGQAALVAAINAANGAGGGTINLAPGCHYALTSSPDNSENGLPVVTTQIGVNGNGATIDGTNSFRVLEVDGPGGNLTLNNVTVTGGSSQDFGGGIASMGARSS